MCNLCISLSILDEIVIEGIFLFSPKSVRVEPRVILDMHKWLVMKLLIQKCILMDGLCS